MLRKFDHHRGFGNLGERVAARYLRRRGYCVLYKNYQSPHGEIDLICSRREWLIFVEVKSRTDSDGPAIQLVHHDQWMRIDRAARGVMAQSFAAGRAHRFDLVVVRRNEAGRLVTEHVQNAYSPETKYDPSIAVYDR
ncbi:MAG: YraN family protein [Planctomycetota bacterium]|jgi:putative endonuclease